MSLTDEALARRGAFWRSHCRESTDVQPPADLVLIASVVPYHLHMARTLQNVTSEPDAELATKPSLTELAAKISQREPYTGPPIAPILRQDRDSH